MNKPLGTLKGVDYSVFDWNCLIMQLCSYVDHVLIISTSTLNYKKYQYNWHSFMFGDIFLYRYSIFNCCVHIYVYLFFYLPSYSYFQALQWEQAAFF